MPSRTYMRTVTVKSDEELNNYLFDLQIDSQAVVITCQWMLSLPDGTRYYHLVYHIPDQETSRDLEVKEDAVNSAEQTTK